MFRRKRGGWGETRVLFLVFVMYPQPLCFFFLLQTLCFPIFGAWLNFVYCLLDNLSFTTVLSGFEINSFDTANH